MTTDLMFARARLEAAELSKRFGTHVAVDRVSFSVEPGQIFGLLGPNAAGKTTVIRMLCGLLTPDAGEIRIGGHGLGRAKSALGYVAQHFGQYEDLSVRENLAFYARMYGISKNNVLDELLERYELAPFSGQLAGTLSGGYKRRLAIVCALAHDPSVLFLDEPTTGIDPVSRKILWDDFYRLSGEGKTLFVTTHYMEEAQRCHHLAFLSAGKVVARGTPTELKGALGETRVLTATLPYHPALQNALLHIPGMLLLNRFGDELRMVVDPVTDRASVRAAITAVTGQEPAIHLDEPNLEDVFIALTQQRVPTS